jgi:hypothetical protein
MLNPMTVVENDAVLNAVITRAWETADRVGADRVSADGRAIAKAGEAASSPRLTLTPAEAAQALGCSGDSRSLYL